jgi:hypothetical protein
MRETFKLQLEGRAKAKLSTPLFRIKASHFYTAEGYSIIYHTNFIYLVHTWGSFGSGVARSAWRERRAVLRVRAGDHWSCGFGWEAQNYKGLE